MAEVLLLEDEPVLRQELCEFLEEQGYAPLGLPTLEAFEQAFDPQRHHLAVIDLGLPDGNGLDLIERLRQDGRQLGIVVFSARHASADKIQGLATGADHFLGKGCDLDELAATLGALSRRLRLDPGPVAATAGCWILESGPRRLRVPGAPAIALSQQDLQVLRCLMSHAGQNISRRQIIERWAPTISIMTSAAWTPRCAACAAACRRPAASNSPSRRCATAAIASICRPPSSPEAAPPR